MSYMTFGIIHVKLSDIQSQNINEFIFTYTYLTQVYIRYYTCIQSTYYIHYTLFC